MRGARRGLTLAVLLGLLAACASESVDEVPAPMVLGAPLDEFPEPFTTVRVGELRDGRVLAYDARERRLDLVDFTQGTRREAARSGAGPLEFQSGLTLAPAPGDSVWLHDLMQARVLVFSPTGLPVRSFLLVAEGSDVMSRMSSPWLRAVDERGDWYATSRALAARLMGSMFADSTAVVRVDGRTARQDTIAMLQARGGTSASPGGPPQRLTAFDPIDAWGVFPDGRVLVVRGATYTPELILSDGQRIVGAAVPYQPVPLTVSAREAVLDSVRRMSASSMADALRQMPGGGGSRALVPNLVAPDPWPDHWPVLRSTTIPVDGRGRAWVAVADAAGEPVGTRYDLLDRDGKLLASVRMPAGVELIGLGRETIYAARRDADDLVWLGRYALP